MGPRAGLDGCGKSRPSPKCTNKSKTRSRRSSWRSGAVTGAVWREWALLMLVVGQIRFKVLIWPQSNDLVERTPKEGTVMSKILPVCCAVSICSKLFKLGVCGP
jgi:hypothetical protein